MPVSVLLQATGEGETALPIDAVGWAVLLVGVAITAAWLLYLLR